MQKPTRFGEFYIAQLPAATLWPYRDEAKFLEFCRQCPHHASLWSCPPYADDTWLREMQKFPHVVLIGLKIEIPDELRQQDTTDKETLKQTARTLVGQGRDKFDPLLLEAERAHAPALSLHAGHCRSCPPDKCARLKNRPCRHPNLMRLSLESCGFDVSKIAADFLGHELKWSRESLPEYFFLVGALMSKTPLTPADFFK